MVGYDQLASVPDAMRTMFRCTAHVMTNPLVEVDGDAPTGTVLCTARHLSADLSDTGALVIVIGTRIDTTDGMVAGVSPTARFGFSGASAMRLSTAASSGTVALPTTARLRILEERHTRGCVVRRSRSRWVVWFTVVVVAALAAAATTTIGGATVRAADDDGISDKTVKLGFVYSQTGVAASIYRTSLDTFSRVDRQNAQGGVNSQRSKLSRGTMRPPGRT